MSTDNESRSTGRFQPQTSREVFALQLAQRLHDEAHVRSYISLLGTYPVPFLLDVYQTAKNETGTPEALRERFWSILGENSDWRMND